MLSLKNIAKPWHLNQTKPLTGTENSTTFTLELEDNSTYIWNCLAYDEAGNSNWSDENFTLYLPFPLNFFQYPTISFHNETTEIIRFEAEKAANGTVEYGTTPSYGNIKNLQEHKIAHEFNITSLTPGTKYYYRINISNISEGFAYFVSFNSSFNTSDDDATSFIFAVLGDTRTQDPSATNVGVNEEIFGKLVSYITERNPDFVINVGDAVDSWTTYATAREAWKEYTDVVWNLTDHIPVFIAIGNHEKPEQEGPLKRYREVVIHPHNGDGSTSCDPDNCYDETTYWFRYGNSLFIFLNTDELPVENEANITGAQYDWFDDTVKKTGYTHKFVFAHRPLVGCNRDGTLLVEDPTWSAHLDNLMYDNGVTAAFYGHEHLFCYNTTHNEEMKHIITGGGGAELASTCNACLGTECFADPEYNYLIVNITGNMMNVTVYNHTNDVKYKFGRIMD